MMLIKKLFINKKVIKVFYYIIVLTFVMTVLLNQIKTKKVIENEDDKINDLIYLKLKDGIVVIETFPQIAPNHVNRIKTLVKEGFYNNNTFFRVIKGFVAQTGDPTGTGRGGSGVNLEPEFSKIPHKRGILSMARASNPASADSQFFIVLEDSLYLDGQYTVWGRVISGMEYVDNIKQAKIGDNGIVSNPDKILNMALGSDVKKSTEQKK